MSEGTPLPSQEASTVTKQPVSESSSENSNTASSMVRTATGLRDVRDLINPVYHLSPMEVHIIETLADLRDTIVTEEQAGDVKTSSLADILTEEEAQRFSASLGNKDIIADHGEYLEIPDEAVEALSKLPPQKRHAVLATTYAKYWLNRSTKKASEADAQSSSSTEPVQEKK